MTRGLTNRLTCCVGCAKPGGTLLRLFKGQKMPNNERFYTHEGCLQSSANAMKRIQQGGGRVVELSAA